MLSNVSIILCPKHVCQPDPEKASLEEAEEKSILEKVKASMTEEDLTELARATEELRLKQETPDPPDALKCVPSLNLSDIPKEPIYVPTEVMIILALCCCWIPFNFSA